MQVNSTYMIPIILVSKNPKKINNFLSDFFKKNRVSKESIYNIFPKIKEIGIAQIREIKKNTVYKISKIQVYILHDFHSSSLEAQNAFLKTLEETPENTQFILITNNQHKLLTTVLSRSRTVILEKDTNSIDNLSETKRELEEFIKIGNLKILSSKKFDTKQEDTIKIVTDLLLFFKNRLIFDSKATLIIKEVLKIKSFIENNNLDEQFSIDYLLIFIRNTYS